MVAVVIDFVVAGENLLRQIDVAAQAAGRPPEEIRSILNVTVSIDADSGPRPDLVTGSAAQVVSQLQELMSWYGFTGFNFMVRDPSDLKRLAEEVVPAVGGDDPPGPPDSRRGTAVGPAAHPGARPGIR